LYKLFYKNVKKNTKIFAKPNGFNSREQRYKYQGYYNTPQNLDNKLNDNF